MDLATFLLDNNNLIDTIFLHHTIAMSFLNLLNKREEDNTTITDRIVEAYMAKRISSSQKMRYESIASCWDSARYAGNNPITLDQQQVFRNNLFLKKEVTNYCR